MRNNPDLSNKSKLEKILANQYGLEKLPDVSTSEVLSLVYDNILISSIETDDENNENKSTLTRYCDKRSGYGMIKPISYQYLPSLNEIDPEFDFINTNEYQFDTFLNIMKNWVNTIEGEDSDYVPYQAYLMFYRNIIGLLGVRNISLDWLFNLTNINGSKLDTYDFNLSGNPINNTIYFLSYRLKNNQSDPESFNDCSNYFKISSSDLSICLFNNLESYNSLDGIYKFDYNMTANETGNQRTIKLLLTLNDSDNDHSDTITINLILDKIKEGTLILLYDPDNNKLINVYNPDETFSLLGFLNISTGYVDMNSDLNIGCLVIKDGDLLDTSEYSMSIETGTLTINSYGKSINSNWIKLNEQDKIINDILDDIKYYLPLFDSINYEYYTKESIDNSYDDLYGITKKATLIITTSDNESITSEIKSTNLTKLTEIEYINNIGQDKKFNDEELLIKWDNSQTSNLINQVDLSYYDLSETTNVIGSYTKIPNPSYLGFNLVISNNDVTSDSMDKAYLAINTLIESKNELLKLDIYSSSIINISRIINDTNNFPTKYYQTDTDGKVIVQLDYSKYVNDYGFLQRNLNSIPFTLIISDLENSIYPYNYYTFLVNFPDYQFNYPLWTPYIQDNKTEELHAINFADDSSIGFIGCYKKSTLSSDTDLNDLLLSNNYPDNMPIYVFLASTNEESSLELIIPNYCNTCKIEYNNSTELDNLSTNKSNLGDIWNCGFNKITIPNNISNNLIEIKLTEANSDLSNAMNIKGLGGLYHGYGEDLSDDDWQSKYDQLNMSNTKVDSEYIIPILILDTSLTEKLNTLSKYEFTY